MSEAEPLLEVKKRDPTDYVVALAGNPNVGKSTIFNALTGLRQHTGNWPGKTVSNAQGYCVWEEQGYCLVDVPGSYSLLAHSAEEEVARDFICFGGADAVIVVCDATCLERNLNLTLQILEVTPNVLVAVNLMDEARGKGMEVDLPLLEARLGVSVVGMAARRGQGIDTLMDSLAVTARGQAGPGIRVTYPDYIEEALALLTPALQPLCAGSTLPARWVGLRLLEGEVSILRGISQTLGRALDREPEVERTMDRILRAWAIRGLRRETVAEAIATAVVETGETLAGDVVRCDEARSRRLDNRLDRLFTSRLTGFPIMLLLLLGIFWLTMVGANYPSALLSKWLFALEEVLAKGLLALGVPGVAVDLLIHGGYKVMAWVVAVMLPPMAIFFPLFTLLEDFGYLPRVAFNLDRCFQACRACGKQALTMCMGFGCNAAGVTGCRIIDSPRERLIAILTNAFVPCNGRFPTMISMISLFLIGSASGLLGSLAGAGILLGVIVLGVGMTLLVSRLLSATVLKGVPSSFTLELPPYRKPQVCKVIVRSVVDRTLKVLGRAVLTAAPAGVLIWLCANVTVGGATVLAHITGFLDPLGRLLGMDGVILAAFILGLPANEIVVPIIIMTYLAQGSLMELDGAALYTLLAANGWSWCTAVSVILFSLMHWPCATTCLTIRKETGSWRWTAVAVIVPTLCGCVMCLAFHLLAASLGWG